MGLPAAANDIEQKRSLAKFFDWYNLARSHQALGWRTPNEAYLGPLSLSLSFCPKIRSRRNYQYPAAFSFS
jgi:hypothetical protein